MGIHMLEDGRRIKDFLMEFKDLMEIHIRLHGFKIKYKVIVFLKINQDAYCYAIMKMVY
jgi:hypothetical protein